MADETVRRLRRIRGTDPTRTRERIVRTLGESSRAEFVLLLNLKAVEGTAFYDRVAVWGDRGLCEYWGTLSGQPAFDGAYDLRRPADRYRNRFETLDESPLDPRKRERLPVWKVGYEPYAVTDQLRTLLYGDDGALLGCIAMMRRRGRSFAPRERDALDDLLSPIRTLLRNSEQPVERSGHALVDRSGRVLRWSDGLSTSQRQLAGRLARDRGEKEGAVELDVAGHHVRLTPLGGPRGACFLVHLEPGARVVLDPCLILSKRQRQVARRLMGDATYRSIADDLNISIHTVKYHARAVYERLEVGDRIELGVRHDIDDFAPPTTLSEAS